MSRIRDVLPSGFALLSIGALLVAGSAQWIAWSEAAPDYLPRGGSMALSSGDTATTPMPRVQPASAPIAEDLLARPLFMRERRPFSEMPVVEVAPAPIPAPVMVPVQAAPEPEPLAPPQAQMIGIYADQSGIAALMRDEAGAEDWIRTGEQLEGWLVTSITRDAITLQSGGESVVITSSE